MEAVQKTIKLHGYVCEHYYVDEIAALQENFKVGIEKKRPKSFLEKDI